MSSQRGNLADDPAQWQVQTKTDSKKKDKQQKKTHNSVQVNTVQITTQIINLVHQIF